MTANVPKGYRNVPKAYRLRLIQRSARMIQFDGPADGALAPESAPCPDSESPSADAQPGNAVLDALPIAVLVTDASGKIMYGNPASFRLLATSSAALRESDWFQFVDVRDQASVAVSHSKADAQHLPVECEVRLVNEKGDRSWVRYAIVSLEHHLENSAYVHVMEDISRVRAEEFARLAAQEVLAMERKRTQVTLAAIDDAVISTNAKGYIVDMNPVAESLTGWRRSKSIGRPLTRVFDVIDSDSRSPARNPRERPHKDFTVAQPPTKGFLLRPDGGDVAIEYSSTPLFNEYKKQVGNAIVFRDYSRSQLTTHKMAHLAHHDFLTGLPNRAAVKEHFEKTIKLNRRHRGRVGVLFIDLNNFKQINDHYGHHTGDCLLKSFAVLLNSCVRETDLVSRYGGDEFVVLLSEINEREDAARAALKIMREAARLGQKKSTLVDLELSIGISMYPEDGDDLDVLIQRADAAMYHVKTGHTNGYSFYQQGMEARPIRSSRQAAEASSSVMGMLRTPEH